MMNMKKIIAFSLWGKDEKYTIGAIRNSELVKTIYPGWICRFYVGDDVPKDIIDTLVENGSEIVYMSDEKCNWTGMFWRFLAASDPDVEVMISRDTDSRLSLREKAAVDEWLSSDRKFHTANDHIWHGVPILGGMWGVRDGFLSNINEHIDNYNKEDRKGTDQDFLKKVIYPIVKNDAMVHDEFFNFFYNTRKFPTVRIDYEFMGDVFDENDVRHPEYWRVLKNYLDRNVR